MADLLAEQPFFAGMRPAHLEHLSSYACRSVFRDGAHIFNEGGRANRCWIIRDGSVELSTRLPDRPDIVIDTLGRGAVLGWSWMFPPHTWQFSAVAVEPTLTIEFKGPDLLRLCEGEPELGYEVTRRLMAVVVQRLQTTRARLTNLLADPR
jgi:CRP/FNR family transcriptional regulator, cyclic AMP receptor protein